MNPAQAAYLVNTVRDTTVRDSTVQDSDFNLSQSEDASQQIGYMQPAAVMSQELQDVSKTHDQTNSETVDLKRGDVLYHDCKDAFMDLQRHKNENNAQVLNLMREMQRLIDEESKDGLDKRQELGELSAIIKNVATGGANVNESSFIDAQALHYSPNLSISGLNNQSPGADEYGLKPNAWLQDSVRNRERIGNQEQMEFLTPERVKKDSGDKFPETQKTSPFSPIFEDNSRKDAQMMSNLQQPGSSSQKQDLSGGTPIIELFEEAPLRSLAMNALASSDMQDSMPLRDQPNYSSMLAAHQKSHQSESNTVQDFDRFYTLNESGIEGHHQMLRNEDGDTMAEQDETQKFEMHPNDTSHNPLLQGRNSSDGSEEDGLIANRMDSSFNDHHLFKNSMVSPQEELKRESRVFLPQHKTISIGQLQQQSSQRLSSNLISSRGVQQKSHQLIPPLLFQQSPAPVTPQQQQVPLTTRSAHRVTSQQQFSLLNTMRSASFVEALPLAQHSEYSSPHHKAKKIVSLKHSKYRQTGGGPRKQSPGGGPRKQSPGGSLLFQKTSSRTESDLHQMLKSQKQEHTASQSSSLCTEKLSKLLLTLAKPTDKIESKGTQTDRVQNSMLSSEQQLVGSSNDLKSVRKRSNAASVVILPTQKSAKSKYLQAFTTSRCGETAQTQTPIATKNFKQPSEANLITPKPLFLKKTSSPRAIMTSQLAKKSSPSDLCKRNPKLYGHRKHVNLKAVKKRKVPDESEVFEIKDLDLKPIMTLKTLGEKLQGVPQPLEKQKLVRKPAVPSSKATQKLARSPDLAKSNAAFSRHQKSAQKLLKSEQKETQDFPKPEERLLRSQYNPQPSHPQESLAQPLQTQDRVMLPNMIFFEKYRNSQHSSHQPCEEQLATELVKGRVSARVSPTPIKQLAPTTMTPKPLANATIKLNLKNNSIEEGEGNFAALTEHPPGIVVGNLNSLRQSPDSRQQVQTTNRFSKKRSSHKSTCGNIEKLLMSAHASNGSKKHHYLTATNSAKKTNVPHQSQQSKKLSPANQGGHKKTATRQLNAKVIHFTTAEEFQQRRNLIKKRAEL